MIKKLALAACIALGTVQLSAQAWKGIGDQKVQAGLSAWGYGTGISVTYNYGIAKDVSLGAGANLYFNGNKSGDNAQNAFLYGRADYHLSNVLSLPQGWDIYPGLDLGILGNKFGFGAHIGVRYFFNEKFGAFLEAGNNGSLGLSINL